MSSIVSDHETQRSCFRPFTREELEKIEKRISDQLLAEKKAESDEKQKEITSKNDEKEDTKPEDAQHKDSKESEPKDDVKSQAKSESKDDVKSQAKSESKDDVKSQAESERKDDVRSQAESEPKDDVKSQAESERKDDVRSQAESEPKDDVKSQAESEPKDDVESRAADEIDEWLVSGFPLPSDHQLLDAVFPLELTATPIVDIDPFYKNKRTFVAINQDEYIFRFNATKSLWLFSPFHQIRRVSIFIFLHPTFNNAMLFAILVNCCLMCVRRNDSVEATELLFTAVYTFECAIKVISLGFVLQPFSYLRDGWNCVDFMVLAFEYLPITGDISSLRAIRVLRALKALTTLPGMKVITVGVANSARSLSDIIILTMIILWVLALLGMQMYMGVLTQKCIKTLPPDLLTNMTDAEIQQYRDNEDNWYVRTEEDETDPLVCGNTSWMTQCPENYTCYKDYGTNPNYGYTSFDNVGWAMLSAFRIMMQDAWEELCQQIIRAQGPWHVLYFVLITFVGFQYLINLTLAAVDRSFRESKCNYLDDEDEDYQSPKKEISDQDVDEAEDSPDEDENGQEKAEPDEMPNDENFAFKLNSCEVFKVFKVIETSPVSEGNNHVYTISSEFQQTQAAEKDEERRAKSEEFQDEILRVEVEECQKEDGKILQDEAEEYQDEILQDESEEHKNEADEILQDENEKHQYECEEIQVEEEFSEMQMNKNCLFKPNHDDAIKTSPAAGDLVKRLIKLRCESAASVIPRIRRTTRRRQYFPLLTDTDDIQSIIQEYMIIEAQSEAVKDATEPHGSNNFKNHLDFPTTSDDDEVLDMIQEYLRTGSNDQENKGATTSEPDVCNNVPNQQKCAIDPNNDDVRDMIEEYFMKASNVPKEKMTLQGITTVEPQASTNLNNQQNFPTLPNNDEVQNIAQEYLLTGSNEQANLKEAISIEDIPNTNNLGNDVELNLMSSGIIEDLSVLKDEPSKTLIQEKALPQPEDCRLTVTNDEVPQITNKVLVPRERQEISMESGCSDDDVLPEANSPDALLESHPAQLKNRGWKGVGIGKKGKWKQRGRRAFLQCIDTWCVWECCECWRNFQKNLRLIVFDAFFELLISLCVIANTVILAMDHHGIDKELDNLLEMGNYIFALIFAMEVVLKMVAISPKNFFKDKWNVFEFFTAVLSITDSFFDVVTNLPIMRSLRLLRIFKLARSWPTLNLLVTIMIKCLQSLGSLCFILLVIVFIFTVMGMELFGESYENNKHKFPNGEIPRWHFCDFKHSFFIVFSVLCGEWIESMWNCMLVSGYLCVPFFLVIVIIGNLMLFNLVVAVMMESFDSSYVVEVEDDAEITEAINRFKRLPAFLKRCFRKIRREHGVYPSRERSVDPLNIPSTSATRGSRPSLKPLLNDFGAENGTFTNGQENFAMTYTLKDEESCQKNGKDVEKAETYTNGTPKPKNNTVEAQLPNGSNRSVPKDNDVIDNHRAKGSNDDKDNAKLETALPKSIADEPIICIKDKMKANIKVCKEKEGEQVKNKLRKFEKNYKLNEHKVKEERQSETEADQVDKDHHNELIIELCCPDTCYDCIPRCIGEHSLIWNRWYKVRSKAGMFLEHKCHKWFIIIWIVVSSTALTLEDKNLEERPLLRDNVKYLDLVFEFVFAFDIVLEWLSLGFKVYFTDPWHWLDFIIHLLSMFSVIGTLLEVGTAYLVKSLRAFRPLRLLHRINSLKILARSLAQAIPPIMNIILVCLIFWLIFSIMGVTLFGGKFAACVDQDGQKYDHLDIPNKTVCEVLNYTWENSKINFDDVGNGFLALFQVATFEGWIEVINNAIDSPEEPDSQPIKENNFYKCFYFVFVIIFGSFFILNLFTSTIIDTFSDRKEQSGVPVEELSTNGDNVYDIALSKINRNKLTVQPPKPKWKPQLIIYNLVMGVPCTLVLIFIITLDVITMTLHHYNIDGTYKQILETISIVCVSTYAIECLLRIIAWRSYYFKRPWCVFDFTVCILSVADVVMTEYTGHDSVVSPVLLRTAKVVRVFKLIRVVQAFRGLHLLVNTLLKPLPILGYTWVFYFLVLFVYAIVGMHFFKNLEYGGALDDTFNFGTFYQSMIFLFQLSTAAGWDGVLEVFTNEDNCLNSTSASGSDQDCATSAVGVAYLVSFVIITYLIIVNMFIAVIVDQFHKVKDEASLGISDYDLAMFSYHWRHSDPMASMYIDLKDLNDLLASTPPPLAIPKPNRFRIIVMDLNIYSGDKMFYVDVLDAVVLHYFQCSKFKYVDKVGVYRTYTKNKLGHERISTTLRRQREEYCARVIQKAWRRFQSTQEIVVKEYFKCVLKKVDRSVAAALPSSKVKRKNSHPTAEKKQHTLHNQTH